MKKFLKTSYPLLIAISIFIGFGLFHLTKFETTDEHFWKYDRIDKYFNGWQEHNFKKTRINDKPGVTLALISGMGRPFIPPLKNHEDLSAKEKNSFILPNGHRKNLYNFFHTDWTEKINLAIRLPLLLFNGLLMLPLIFFALQRAFNKQIANWGIILIGSNPILTGISQIINPDALLWSFSAVALFSFIALLKTNERKFIFLTGIMTGLALLSKYTANLLFVFYTLIYILYLSNKHSGNTLSLKNTILTYGRKMISIIAIAWSIVIILMPAVLIIPRHFLYATTHSPVFQPFIKILSTAFHLNNLFYLDNGHYRTIPLGLFSLVVFFVLFIILPPVILTTFKKYPKITELIGKFFIILLLSIFTLSFINAWFNTPLFSLDNLKETSLSGGVLKFKQLHNQPFSLFWTNALLIQAQNFIFSLRDWLTPILLSGFILALKTKKPENQKINRFVYFSAIIPFIFFIGGLFANIFVNVRYSLMLYPVFMIVGATVLTKINEKITSRFYRKVLFFIILLFSFTSLWQIKPFYFNYTNNLLPHKYVVTDAWGYGLYEAAQYLNSLPNAQNITAWSDQEGLCQFFIGKCIRGHKIYIDYVKPDYILITRRGYITKRPVTRHFLKQKSTIDLSKAYSQTGFASPAWQLNIGGRPKNFVKIIKLN